MTEEEFEQEVTFFRHAILEAIVRIDPRFSWRPEVPELYRRLETLAQEDRKHFRMLGARLLQDENHEVCVGTMRLLSSLRIKDNVLSLGLVWIAMKQKDLRKEALEALWGVYTRAVLPQLFLFAEKGYSDALYMVTRLIRTPEEIERGIAIARKYIDAKEYYLREAALFLLQRYSSIEFEAERILAAVQIYLDELFIDALDEAPPEVVLEPLKALRSTIDEKYAEYRDLSFTIDKLEQKMRKEDE